MWRIHAADQGLGLHYFLAGLAVVDEAGSVTRHIPPRMAAWCSSEQTRRVKSATRLLRDAHIASKG